MTTCFESNPVSFRDGYGIMPTAMGGRRELELNYSVTSRHAVALNAINLEYQDREATLILPQFNYRVYRRNELDLQANL